MNKIYSGIGSREIPYDVEELMVMIGKFLALKGFTLRSGGADGSDISFETGCDLVNGNKEIYIPWMGFNKSKSNLYNITEEALELTSNYHPYWKNLKLSVRHIMARNAYQVLGFDLKTPTDFIVCWTKDGKDSGGTGQAIRIAKNYNIPIYNIKNEIDKELLFEKMRSLDNTE